MPNVLRIRNLTQHPWQLYHLERWTKSLSKKTAEESGQSYENVIIPPFSIKEVGSAGHRNGEYVVLYFGAPPPQGLDALQDNNRKPDKYLKFRCPVTPGGKSPFSCKLEPWGPGWKTEEKRAQMDEEILGLFFPSLEMMEDSMEPSIKEMLSEPFLTLLSAAELGSWMSKLPDDTPLTNLSIPGTHNSHTYFRALPSVRCQAVSVRDQLQNGIRFLDIRVSVGSVGKGSKQGSATSPLPALGLVHGAFPAALFTRGNSLASILQDVYAFLDSDQGKKETVLVSLKREGLGRGKDSDLALLLREYYCADPQRWWSPSVFSLGLPANLGEVRGRCVLVKRFKDPWGAGPYFHENEDIIELRKHPLGGRKEVGDGTLTDGEDGVSIRFDVDGYSTNNETITDSAYAHGKLNDNNNGRFGIDASAWPDNCADGHCPLGLDTTVHLRIQDWYGVGKADNIPRKIRYIINHLERAGTTKPSFPHWNEENSGTLLSIQKDMPNSRSSIQATAALNPIQELIRVQPTQVTRYRQYSTNSVPPRGFTDKASTAIRNASGTERSTSNAISSMVLPSTVASTTISSATTTTALATLTTTAATIVKSTPNRNSDFTAPLFLNFLTGSNFFSAACWPEKIAARVNPAVIRYLCMRHGVLEKENLPASFKVHSSATGIVVMDWVGLDGDWDLVRCVVAMNSHLMGRKSQDTGPDDMNPSA